MSSKWWLIITPKWWVWLLYGHFVDTISSLNHGLNSIEIYWASMMATNDKETIEARNYRTLYTIDFTSCIIYNINSETGNISSNSVVSY